MHRSAGLYTNFMACDRPELLNIKELIFKRKMWLQIDAYDNHANVRPNVLRYKKYSN